MDRITAIGVMSGTSVDGLDIIAAEFTLINRQWSYKLLKWASITYPHQLKQKLIDCINLSGEDLIYLDYELGKYIGNKVMQFCKNEKFKPEIVASHGHTVFHQPEQGITCQIGDGLAISNITKITVINDFRKIDILTGGQGAPLVPVGDKFLFGNFNFCLNLGGFSNVSFDTVEDKRIAYDICPTNILLNYLARQTGKSYDDKGTLASKGKLNEELLYRLNEIEYYNQSSPKSLGLEWVKKNIFPLLDAWKINIPDGLRTCVEHIAYQINRSINSEIYTHYNKKKCRILVTGGGAFNNFLIDRMKMMAADYSYFLPQIEIINFKEALIFAFLGVLRKRGEINIWRSVTGADQDSSAGTIHLAR